MADQMMLFPDAELSKIEKLGVSFSKVVINGTKYISVKATDLAKVTKDKVMETTDKVSGMTIKEAGKKLYKSKRVQGFAVGTVAAVVVHSLLGL